MTTPELSSAQDARVVRTRQALREALLGLLEHKPLEQITIREIAAGAGIHYATFFRHHPTRDALLDDIAAEQIDRLVELTVPILDRADSEAALVALCSHVSEQRSLWTALLTGGAAGAMREELLRQATAVALDRVAKDSWVPVELAVICTVSVIVETLAWWLAQADPLPVTEMSKILDRLIIIRSLLQDAKQDE